MADVRKYTEQIAGAKKGKDVRSAIINAISNGIKLIIDAAIIFPVNVPVKSFIEAIPNGSVFIAVSLTVISGHVRLPH